MLASPLTTRQIHQAQLPPKLPRLLIPQQNLADGVASAARIVGLGGVGGAVAVAGVDEGKEVGGGVGLVFFQAGYDYFAWGVVCVWGG